MPQEQMSQAEIDALMKNIMSDSSADLDISSLGNIDANSKQWRCRIRSALNRYHWMLENGDYEQVVEARRYLHQSAFQLWLYNHGFTSRNDFFRRMNKEARKRGMKPPFKDYIFG